MKHKGILIVVSGFSGSGKGTVMKELVNQQDGYKLSVSATTRLPREGEQDGRDYFFLTRKKFESMISEEQFIEYASYVGNYYGTPKKYVEEQLEAGFNVILEIEIQGALLVQKAYPDALLLFLTPPSADILKRRLTGRGTESEVVIDKRLEQAIVESQYMEHYDYLVINDKLEECVELVHNIICAEHNKMKYNSNFASTMQEQLKAIMKGEQ